MSTSTVSTASNDINFEEAGDLFQKITGLTDEVLREAVKANRGAGFYWTQVHANTPELVQAINASETFAGYVALVLKNEPSDADDQSFELREAARNAWPELSKY